MLYAINAKEKGISTLKTSQVEVPKPPQIDVMNPLNSPLAIVAIIFVCAIAFREIAAGIKSITGKTPYQDLAGAIREFRDAINQLSTNMTILNKSQEQMSKDFEKNHLSIVRRLEDIYRWDIKK